MELEQRIKSEFDNMEVDYKHILQSRRQDMAGVASMGARNVNLAIKNRSMRRHVRVAVAVIAILLTVSATVFAVGSYLGAFDRLRGVIGEEHSSRLSPAEIINVDGVSNADNAVEFITDSGIKIEFVAVGVLSNTVDFYFTVEDLVGNRLDGDVWIFASVYPGEDRPGVSVIELPKVIDRTDDGIVTLHSRQVFDYPISGQELHFNLRSISYNRRSGEHKIDFDFTALAPQTPVAWLWETPILQPHQHDIKLELDGFDNTWNTQLSGIGILDGKLHIQQMSAPPSRSDKTFAYFFLAGPRGEHLPTYEGSQWPLSILSFKIDEHGNYTNDQKGLYADISPELSHLPYREDIYEVDLERLSEYGLVVMYSTEEQIYIDWDVSIRLDIPSEGAELVADGLDIELESCRAILREVRVTPYNVLIRADYIEALSVNPNPVIVINTTHRAVSPIDGSMMFSNQFDDSGHSLVGFTIVKELIESSNLHIKDVKLFDLDSVISVEIDGNVIEFG